MTVVALVADLFGFGLIEDLMDGFVAEDHEEAGRDGVEETVEAPPRVGKSDSMSGTGHDKKRETNVSDLRVRVIRHVCICVRACVRVV